MRKLETAEEREAKQQKTSRIIGIFLLLIMVLSTAGYAFMYFQENSDNSPTRSKVSDQLQTADGRWVLNFNDQQLLLQTSEQSAQNISNDLYLTISNFFSQKVYIDYQNNSGVYYEIASNLAPFTEKLIPACYGPCQENLPEKNCSSLMIVYKKSNANRVYQNESCVFIEGDIRAADSFIYKLFE